MIRRRTLLAALGASPFAAATLSGCSDDTPDTADAGAPANGTPANGTPANGAEVDVATFVEAMKAPGTVVLDVHTPAEFGQGHLEDAINIDVEAADFSSRVGALAKDVPYAVYCRSGNRSGVAVRQMTDQGFTSTYHLAGGISAWQAAGLPVVTG
ncbi:rhodanese-like domain-containing protein [Aestuariimicrobium ganziense]|uniref:rhodanese-like domain-containing protein n=1 Tax=Aestuariimicrobium ganziense TaxID=2773677 RepID=UPI0019452FA1|nr:rhodanese-like domain-containing protein [Aestuariimicrobium ganziense]